MQAGRNAQRRNYMGTVARGAADPVTGSSNRSYAFIYAAKDQQPLQRAVALYAMSANSADSY